MAHLSADAVKAFSLTSHVASSASDGGCDHMKCSACGRDFSWSQQPVEVPCNCLNLTRPGGDMKTFKVRPFC
eukprot:6200842-Pleurochrysis_carterae.AAC.1